MIKLTRKGDNLDFQIRVLDKGSIIFTFTNTLLNQAHEQFNTWIM
jgi:hypothetical protein